MKEKVKLSFKKEVIERLDHEGMNHVKGGTDVQTEIDLFGSRLFCATNTNKGCGISKSCQGWICIPLFTNASKRCGTTQ